MISIRRPGLSGALFLLSLALAPTAGALTFVRSSDAQLVDRADVIVRAVARPLERPPAVEGLPATHYALEVKKALRGAAAGETLEIEIPGGRDAEGYVAIVFGAPRLSPGEEALFFLQRGERGALQILDFQQGIFRVTPLPEGRAAWRSLAEHHELTIAGRELDEEKPRSLEGFERWIAARLAGDKRGADYWLAAETAALLASRLEARTAASGVLPAPSPFTNYPSYGIPVRWPKTTGRLDLTFQALDVPQPELAGGGYAEVAAALAAWSDLPEGLLRLRYGGQTSASAGFGRRDGINGIIFADVGGTLGSRPSFDCSTGTGALAYGNVWLSPATHVYGGTEYGNVIEADTVLARNLHCWSHFGSASFEQIVAHEVGHNLAIGHSCGDDNSGPCDTPEKDQAIMRARFRHPPSGARLGEDDRKAIAFFYGPPAAPGNLAARLDAGNRVTLTWEDRSESENGFHIYRERGSQSQQIGSVGPGVRRFEDGDTVQATSYRYLVRSFNEGGISAAAEITVTTAALDTPTGLAATATGPASLALVWVDKSGNETGYEVWGGLANMQPEELLAALPANSQTATIANLIADSAYTFRVRATGTPSGNTAFSNAASATTLPAPIEPCTDGAASTCLSAERFQVVVRWKDHHGQRGVAAVAPAGSADSGIFYFFSPSNWEMLVKVLDGCAINQKHWVFAAATTDVETTLIVTDSQTGKTAVYFNPAGAPAPAITDIEAFAGCPESAAPKAAPGDVQSPHRTPTTPEAPTSFPRRRESSLPPQALAAGCDGEPGNLCLQGGRYDVAVTFTDFAGVSGSGKAVPAGTADSGLFTFFSPDNWEMLVKVLDGCAINQKVWVFAAATTNVAYTLTVTDTATGVAKSYENRLGQASPAITDIEAFAGCSEP